MKKYFSASLLVLWLFAGMLYGCNGPEVIEVYESPNGAYTLVVKAKERGVNAPGNSGPGNTPAVIVLKDQYGTVIAKSTQRPQCGLPVGSIEIRWDLENDFVWYARAKFINVKTGKVGC